MEMTQEDNKELKKHVLKTGTTTVGIVCKDGIVLAADKRSTYGGEGGVSYIASKDHEKVQKVNENILVTTAGVASDTQRVIKLVRAELRLKELRNKHDSSIKEAANLFSNIVYQNIRQFSTIMAITHFLLAGKDGEKAYLYEISADGLVQEVDDYKATGSGMVQCNPILDSEYTPNMTLEEGIKLVKKCINASIKRDPASGEGIDVFTITKDEIKQVVKQEIVPEYKNRA